MYKQCPYCAEDVKQAALKCKHCGSDLREHPFRDDFQKLFSGSAGLLGWRDKAEMWFQEHAPAKALITIPRLPDQSVGFGVCAGFAFHHGWSMSVVRLITLFLILVVGVLPGAILYLFLAYAMPALRKK